MKASEFCNREVMIIERDASVAEAARLMRELHVGSLVVVTKEAGQTRPTGILTDRDIVIEFVAEGLSPQEVAVGDAMSFQLATVDEDAGLFETIELMRDRGVRRLPVVDSAGTLVGLVAADDALELLAEQLNDLVKIVGRQQRIEAEHRG